MYETKQEKAKLIIKQAKFITSAAKAEQFIRPDKPMIAVCGKSNVGKSSFINMLANQKKLAKTSSEPGRTRFVNYFDFGAFILYPATGLRACPKAKRKNGQKRWTSFSSAKKISRTYLCLPIVDTTPPKTICKCCNFCTTTPFRLPSRLPRRINSRK